MDTTVLVYFGIIAVIGIITLIKKNSKTNRLRAEMQNLQRSSDIHEMLIMNNCSIRSKRLTEAYHNVYKLYIDYMLKGYANTGTPGGRGNQSLYQAASAKGTNSFFIITFYWYMSDYINHSYKFTVESLSLNLKHYSVFT